jgi:hypothetical protein
VLALPPQAAESPLPAPAPALPAPSAGPIFTGGARHESFATLLGRRRLLAAAPGPAMVLPPDVSADITIRLTVWTLDLCTDIQGTVP